QRRSINNPELRPGDMPAQDLELVAQHKRLNLRCVQTTATTQEHTEQSPHCEVKKREGHAADPPRRPEPREMTPLMTPFRPTDSPSLASRIRKNAPRGRPGAPDCQCVIGVQLTPEQFLTIRQLSAVIVAPVRAPIRLR